MTSMQVAYFDVMEKIRTNQANEAEAKRHNITWEAETTRHNMANESLTNLSILEGRRHNLMTENIALRDLSEKARANRAQESLKLQGILETARANRASERLRGSQIANEWRLGLMHAANEQRSIRAQEYSNRTARYRAANDYALGRARNEIESKRASEQNRHNVASEGISWFGNFTNLLGTTAKLMTVAGGIA